MYRIGRLRTIVLLIAVIVFRIAVAAVIPATVLPDLALLLICFLAFYVEMFHMILLGCVCGYVLDSLSGAPFGVHFISYSLTSIAAVILSKRLFREGPLMCSVVAGSMTAFLEVVRWSLFYMAGVPLAPEGFMQTIVFPEMLINAGLALPAFFFFRALLMHYVGTLTFDTRWKKYV